MNPRCAACGGPIIKGRGGKLTIVDTEAFHQACVLNGGVAKSANNQLKAKIRDLAEQVRRERGQLENERDKTRQAARESRVTITNANDRTRQALGITSALRVERDNARALLEIAQSTVEAKDLIIRDLKADLVTRPAPNPTPAEEKAANVEEDGTAMRFSLLELDLP